MRKVGTSGTKGVGEGILGGGRLLCRHRMHCFVIVRGLVSLVLMLRRLRMVMVLVVVFLRASGLVGLGSRGIDSEEVVIDGVD